MSKDVEIVREFYNNAETDEWGRFDRVKAEFELTRRVMSRYIKPGDTVLDVGGGPGRYSLWLAGMGCDVTLVDLAANHVNIALEKATETGVAIRAYVGDARYADTLPQLTEQFDHVLLMGPLYHLLQESDRERAVKACLTLLKPGGIFYASFISSFAGVIYMMKFMPELLASNPHEEIFRDLIVQDKEYAGTAFTEAYFIRQQDVLPFMAKFPLEKLCFFGQEGILSPCENNIFSQPDDVVERWLDLAEKLCERESLLSYAEHLMYIGRKPE